MGWAYCGLNTLTGDEMGYSVEGVCHSAGCGQEIDHGLSYVCGGMHEGGNYGCGRYFCQKHLTSVEIDGDVEQLCNDCAKNHPE